MIAAAAREGVAVAGVSPYRLSPAPRGGLIFGYSNLNERAIAAASAPGPSRFKPALIGGPDGAFLGGPGILYQEFAPPGSSRLGRRVLADRAAR